MHELNSAESIYAEYVFSRIPKHIREGFTKEQANDIRHALIDDIHHSRSAVKFLTTLPIFFRRYYLVVMLGRDRRLMTLMQEDQRKRLVPAPIRGMFYTALLGLTITSFGLMSLIGLYMFKRWLGIDVFPNHSVSGFVIKFFEWIS